MKCEDCKYYLLLSANAVIYREGECRRYPAPEKHMRTHWCGEFVPKKVKPAKKTTKKTPKRAKKVSKKKPVKHTN